MSAPVSCDSGIEGTHGDRYMPPAILARAASTSPSVTIVRRNSERQLDPRLRRHEHAAELALDALERGRIVGFEAQHDRRRRVRAAREAEAVRILDAETVDPHDVGRAGELRLGPELGDDRVVLAFGAGDGDLGR